MNTCKSLNQAFSLADLESDAGRQNIADALNFSAGSAQYYLKTLQRLAWACTEKNSAKRTNILQIVLMELETNGESLASFPSRQV